MAFADDYALIGSFYGYGASTQSMFNLERRYTSTVKEGLDINLVDDETETDVEFMTHMYRNSHPQYFLGSWIVKPVIEILLHYMGYPRVTSKDSKLAKRLNEFYEASKSSIQQLFRELGLFGEEYAVLGYDSELKMPTIKPRNKTFIVETRYEDINNPDELTYIAVKDIISRVKPGYDSATSNKEQVTFLRTYRKVRNPAYLKAIEKDKSTDGIEPWIYYAKMDRKEGGGSTFTPAVEEFVNEWNTIPIQSFNQNRMSNDVNGYSDVNGLIKLAQVYHQVFESMIDTNIYNGKPTTVFSGLSDAEKFIRTTYGEVDPVSNSIGTMGSYELFGSYYLEGTAQVSYLQVDNRYVEGAKEILRLLFYIYVQLSGVPEWALGAHIDGTYASTKMQSTPLIQKIESKRLDVNDAIVSMNVKLAKIIEANEGVKFGTYLTQLEWSEPLPEDRDYILAAIEKVIPLDILTSEKILELLDIVASPADEIKKREKQKKEQELKQNVNADDLAKRVLERVNAANAQTETEAKVNPLEEGEASEMSAIEILERVLGPDYLEELGLA